MSTDSKQEEMNEIVPTKNVGTIDVASSRAIAEIQSAMTIAKRFPRDEMASFSRIIQACKRKTLAEVAMYAYPKGGTTVTGPSIRLSEAIAQNWGNLDFGIVELEQRHNESTVMAYAWDLETNTRQTKVFQVKHERHTRAGVQKLTDPRDIYELVANQGARRLRACILGVVPGDVVDAAVDACEKTLATSNGDPLVDRVRKMVVAFADMGVNQEMIERRLGHKIESTVEAEFVVLRKIFQSIRDGMADRLQFFELSQPQADKEKEAVKSRTDKLADDIAGKKPESPKEKPVEQPSLPVSKDLADKLLKPAPVEATASVEKPVDKPAENPVPPQAKQLPRQTTASRTKTATEAEPYGEKSDRWMELMKLIKQDNDRALSAKERLGWLNTPFLQLRQTQIVDLIEEIKKPLGP